VEASTSAHGGWKRWDVVNPWNIDGSAFKVKYFQDTKVFGTHALDIPDDSGGGKSPRNQYELLPGPARNSPNNVNWGSANFILLFVPLELGGRLSLCQKRFLQAVLGLI
jgi:necrosis inducing protein (NPP1)